MKALLLKDYYVIMGTMKAAMILASLCIFIPVGSAAVMPMLVAALLPITCLGMDEMAKWQRIQAAMPYQKRDIVLSKYVLGIISVVSMSITILLVQMLMGAIIGKPISAGTLYAILIATLGGVLLQTVIIPLIFRFGVEKARIAMRLLFGVAAGGVMLMANAVTFRTSLQLNGIIVIAAIGLIALLYPLSIFASMKLYRAKR